MSDYERLFAGSMEGNHDPAKFYTRSTNRHDHFTELTVRIPPDIHAQILHLIGLKIIPEYRSPADIVRDALVHRLTWVHDNILDDPKLADALTDERVIAQQDQMLAAIQTRENVLQNAREIFAHMLRIGDWVSASNALAAHREATAEWPEMWRRQMMDLLDDVAQQMEVARGVDPRRN